MFGYHYPLLLVSFRLSHRFAEHHGKPWIHIDLEATSYPEAARMVREWVGRYSITVLNVAGARGSKDPMIYQAVTELLEATLGESKSLMKG
jgi:hypothetical protein